MKRMLAVLLPPALLLAVCMHPVVGVAPVDAAPPVRVAVHASPDGLSDTEAIPVWAEAQRQLLVSALVPDPEDGVWGAQAGELFHFRVQGDHTYGRITYGRPHPAAVSVGDLVRLSERRLAGRVTTLHLMRQAQDGKITEVASGRSPGGTPFDLLDERQGALHLHDESGVWYTLTAEGNAFQAVQEFTPGHITSRPSPSHVAKEGVERETDGRVSWMVSVADGSSYALVGRNQLFTFDVDSRQFRLLGQSALQPVGSLNGQIVARSEAGLAIIDSEGRTVREFPVDLNGASVLPGADGWFYSLPTLAINLVTGEQRRFPMPGVLGGGVTALVPLDDGRMVGGTGHWGSLFVLDVRTGEITVWGRPIPELGQLGGEEMAPIDGLVRGADKYLYAAIGSGASGRAEAHMVRIAETGRVVAKVRLSAPVHSLVRGADGRIYGSGLDRVVVLPPS